MEHLKNILVGLPVIAAFVALMIAVTVFDLFLYLFVAIGVFVLCSIAYFIGAGIRESLK